MGASAKDPKVAQAWRKRWPSVIFTASLARAAELAGVADIWRDSKAHGKLKGVKTRLKDYFGKELEARNAFSAGEEYTTLPTEDRLYERLQDILKIYVKGSKRKDDCRTDTEWNHLVDPEVGARPRRSRLQGLERGRSLLEANVLHGPG